MIKYYKSLASFYLFWVCSYCMLILNSKVNECNTYNRWHIICHICHLCYILHDYFSNINHFEPQMISIPFIIIFIDTGHWTLWVFLVCKGIIHRVAKISGIQTEIKVLLLKQTIVWKLQNILIASKPLPTRPDFLKMDQNLTPICKLWTKNPQTGFNVERHLWTKNPQMTIHDVPKWEFFIKFRKSKVAICCRFFVHKRRSTTPPKCSR